MNRLGSFFLAVLLAVLWFSAGTAQELRKSGRYYIADITKSFKVDKTGNLHVYEIRGDVQVESWDRAEVLIKETKKMDVYTREEAETVLEKSKSSYRQVGNDIEIGGEYYRRDWIQSEFMISLPRGFNVSIETRGGDITVSTVDGVVDLRTSGGDIGLRNIGGEIEAKTSGGDVKVENCRSRTTLKTSGGDLTLLDIDGPLVAKTSGGDIRLERAKKNVDVSTSGGSIVISDVKAEVSAKTSGGDIELNDVAGNAEINTSGGDIEFKNVAGSLDASTSGGDIEGAGVKGNAWVSTSGGSIELTDVKGGVEGKTAGGNIHVEITLTDFSQPHAVDLRTAGGEITLVLPSKIPAKIRAEIELSDRWRDYNIYSDFPLTTNEEGEGKGERRRSERRNRFITSTGDINGGGDLIELFATDGDIYIKKAK